jgi:hypothetical protein
VSTAPRGPRAPAVPTAALPWGYDSPQPPLILQDPGMTGYCRCTPAGTCYLCPKCAENACRNYSAFCLLLLTTGSPKDCTSLVMPLSTELKSLWPHGCLFLREVRCRTLLTQKLFHTPTFCVSEVQLWTLYNRKPTLRMLFCYPGARRADFPWVEPRMNHLDSGTSVSIAQSGEHGHCRESA